MSTFARGKACDMPLRQTMCATCPWRDDSPYVHLRGPLSVSALQEASRICHSTGSNNGINRRTGKPPAICRGARDVQLKYFHGIRFIDAPTDDAWTARWNQMKQQKTAK